MISRSLQNDISTFDVIVSVLTSESVVLDASLRDCLVAPVVGADLLLDGDLLGVRPFDLDLPLLPLDAERDLDFLGVFLGD